MSRIIRNASTAPTILIGERHFNLDKEAIAAARLRDIMPMVSVMTDSSGAQLIPIAEVEKISTFIDQQKAKSYQEGYQQGTTQGHQKGLDEGLAKARETLQQFEGAIREAVSQRQALFDQARQNILDLVLKISKKITFDAVKAEPELTLKMINGVIDTLIDRSKIKIKVNPDHLPIVEQNINSFLDGKATIKEISIEPDTRVRYGGCFIETPTGDIDARLESQFEVIAELLANSEVD